MTLIRRLAVLGALALATAACSPSPPRPTTPPRSAAPAKAPASPGASPGASPVAAETRLGDLAYTDHGFRDVQGRSSQDVDVGDYYFKGTFLRGDPGQKLTLRIRNVAQTPHNFSLPSQQLDRDIPTGRERVGVEVTFPESGALRFFCKLHADRGMNGQLLVGNAEPQPLAGLVRPSGS